MMSDKFASIETCFSPKRQFLVGAFEEKCPTFTLGSFLDA